MNNLTLKGTIEVDEMKFNHIEGGFGENKKSMLAKDIARIHGKKLKYINQSINMNKSRFKNNIDLIDLKGSESEVNLIDHQIYSQNGLNRSKNIYLLSERGYSKLLKILEDDFAWEQYEKLVDVYFNMRQALKESYMIEDPIERAKAWITEQEEKQQLKLTSEKQKQIIGELKPKADYTDKILKNKGLVTITQIAKDYGMSGQAMNKLLYSLGVQYKQSGQWLLYSKHHGKGYTHSETVDITRSDGRADITMTTKWTQKGRLFLYNLLKENNFIPDIEKVN